MKKFLKWAGIVIGVLILGGLAFGYYQYYQFQKFLDDPIVRLVPVARQLNQNFTFQGRQKISTVGLAMNLPWDSKIASSQPSNSEGFESNLMKFESGKGLLIGTQPNKMIEALTQNPPEGFTKESYRQALETYFGTGSMQSEYQLLKAILETTPPQAPNYFSFLNFFKRFSNDPEKNSKAVGELIAVTLKKVIVVGSPTAIYAFETTNIKGFQFDIPASDQKSALVNVKFFDINDKAYDLTTNATQDEIDYILSSIKPEK